MMVSQSLRVNGQVRAITTGGGQGSWSREQVKGQVAGVPRGTNEGMYFQPQFYLTGAYKTDGREPPHQKAAAAPLAPLR